MNRYELLAPAGDRDSFDAAIANGANAVYLGLGSFNARIKAQNFDEKNLRECVKKAHFFGVKVYVTLNTLVQNSEFSDMIKAVKVAVLAKVDAFIVQDLGVCLALKRVFPNIVLHASTQMGIHNLYGAKIAESLGLSRIVLSRETKLSDIKAIRENTNLELEFFVQGALCVAFSGNCYLSSLEYDNSGNRGVCKQPCRMCYEAEQNNQAERKIKTEQGYMLSARDLCLISNLNDLVDAGVQSFKIEGRLRRAGYVAETVDCYRKALDNLENNMPTVQSSDINLPKRQNFGASKNSGNKLGSNGLQTEITRLKKVFNRGDYLSRAYLDSGVPDNVVNKISQNHQGIAIGKVVDVKPFKDILAITIESKHKLAVGDGLKFFENGVECGSLGIGSLKEVDRNTYTIFSKAKANVGQSVNLILDSRIEEEALARKKYVSVDFRVKAKVGDKLELCAKSGDVEVNLSSDFICEKAINKATQKDEIINQVAKTADSGFEAKSVEVETDGVFLPKSVLNGLRRECLSQLEEKIVENNEKYLNVQISEEEISNVLKEAKYGMSCGNTNSHANKNNLYFVYSDKNSDMNAEYIGESNSIFAISPSEYCAKEIERLVKRVKALRDNCKIALVLPIIANGADLMYIENSLKSLTESGTVFEYLVSNNIYGLYFKNSGYKIIAGFGQNVFNNLATSELEILGASIVVPSVELKLIEKKSNSLKSNVDANTEYEFSSLLPICEMQNFRLPLMTFAHCPFKTLNENPCKNCSFVNNTLAYNIYNKQYEIHRVKLAQCYFVLNKS
ncbi:MAG: U32 family peptidase [Clostridia bacterium]|nr:U32 family peptidase [Clostridia bacterium]